MAAPRRASSGSRSGGRSSRSSGSGNGSQSAMVLGGIGLLVVVVIIVLASQSSGGGGSDTNQETPAKAAAPEQSGPKPVPVQLGDAKGGKTPARPAPALSTETLAKVREIEAQMKVHFNDGVKARNEGDNATAREHQAKAVGLIDDVDQLVAKQLEWQEEAEMGNWAQPAEYVTLAKTYGAIMTLVKKAKMAGGIK